MTPFDFGIRDPNPCHGCSRPQKCIGCHATCEDRKKWKDELDRVNAARKAYNRSFRSRRW